MSSDLDKTTQQQLGRGQRMQEILKQPQYVPMSLADQVIAIFAGTNGFADQVPVDKMVAWQAELLRYMEASYPEIVKEISEKKIITDDDAHAADAGASDLPRDMGRLIHGFRP